LCLAVTPDAKTVFAGSHDGVVHVWNSDRKLLANLAPTTNGTVTGKESASQAKRGRRNPSPPQVRASAPRVAAGQRRDLPGVNAIALRPSAVVSLSAEPAQVKLSPDAPRHGVLITARTADGFDVDVTDRVPFSTTPRAPFEVGEHGAVRALRPGEG